MANEVSLKTVSPDIAANTAPQVRLQPVDNNAAKASIRQVSPPDGETMPVKRQSIAELAHTVESLNIKAQQVQRQLEFRVDEASGRTIVTVRDKETGEVIRQIPPEEMIEIGQRLKELTEEILGDKDVSGLLVKKQA